MSHAWVPPTVRTRAEDLRAGRSLGDFVSLNLMGNIPVLGDRAVTVLRPLLEPAGELLPLNSATSELWAMNVLQVCDVLDEGPSDVDLVAPGRIGKLRRFVGRTPA